MLALHRAEHPALAQESVPDHLVLDMFGADQFDCDRTAQERVFGQVNQSHATLAQQGLDPHSVQRSQIARLEGGPE